MLNVVKSLSPILKTLIESISIVVERVGLEHGENIPDTISGEEMSLKIKFFYCTKHHGNGMWVIINNISMHQCITCKTKLSLSELSCGHG